MDNEHLIGKKCHGMGTDGSIVGEIISISHEFKNGVCVKWPNGNEACYPVESLVILSAQDKTDWKAVAEDIKHNWGKCVGVNEHAQKTCTRRISCHDCIFNHFVALHTEGK